MARRAELDEGSDVDPAIEMKRFEKELFALLQKCPDAASAPVCKWSEPEGKILEKSEEDLKMISGEDGGATNLPMLAIGAVGVIGVLGAMAHQMGMLEGVF